MQKQTWRWFSSRVTSYGPSFLPQLVQIPSMLCQQGSITERDQIGATRGQGLRPQGHCLLQHSRSWAINALSLVAASTWVALLYPGDSFHRNCKNLLSLRFSLHCVKFKLASRCKRYYRKTDRVTSKASLRNQAKTQKNVLLVFRCTFLDRQKKQVSCIIEEC